MGAYGWRNRSSSQRSCSTTHADAGRAPRRGGDRKTRTILVRRPLPVLVLYWTAAVDPDGRVRFLPDVYERDPAIIRGLAQPVAARQRTVSTRTNDGAA